MIKSRLSLKVKLFLSSLTLIVIPVAIVGFLSSYHFSSFSEETIRLSRSGMEEEAIKSLSSGVSADKATVQAFIDKAQSHVRDIAGSSRLVDYLNTLDGKNQEINSLVEKEISRIVEGIAKMCGVQQEQLQNKLQSNLAVTGHILNGYGSPLLAPANSQWKAVNQFTNEEQSVSLPVLQIGAVKLSSESSQNDFIPIVDESAKILGGSCTIFQKMNDAGDMLRVATNVRTGEGKRGTGTYIPYLGSEDKPSAILSKILNGETFLGRAFVVDAWWMAIYKPLYDEGGRLIGMIYNGIKEQEGQMLRKEITQVKIGRSGITFVMDSKGNVIVHPKADMVGKDASMDLKIPDMKAVLDHKNDGKTTTLQYTVEGRRRLLTYLYYEPWDQFICGTGFLDELTEANLQSSMDSFKNENLDLYKTSYTLSEPTYNQMRFINAKGMEIVNLKGGSFTDNLLSKANEAWFKECLKLKKGETHNSGVVIAANTGKPEMRIAAPVFIGEELKGIAVLSVDWQLAWKMVKGHVYGKTGYPYIINDKGVLVSHPKYDLGKGFDLTDPKNGVELSQIVKEHMLRGEEGFGKYMFENIQKYVCFAPLQFNGKTYTIAATSPVEEFLALSNDIKSNADAKASRSATVILSAMGVMVILGGLGGLLFSRTISRPLIRIIRGLAAGAEHVASASSQISSSTQELSEGASQQAAAIEETASSLEEMASMTSRNAQNAYEANDLMVEAKAIVERTHRSMTDLTSSMEQISTASGETQKIVKTIDEIAFRTNLLALNAAVEAARAGEAGAGFAVVADEVRSLAIRSAEAAKNTAELIEGTVSKVSDGARMVKKSNDEFNELASKVSKSGQLLEQIANASDEQAKGISQINKAIAEMEDVTQRNAAGAEESASACEELSAQADNMSDFVEGLVALVEGDSSKTKKNSAGMLEGNERPKLEGGLRQRLALSLRSRKALPGKAQSDEDIID